MSLRDTIEAARKEAEEAGSIPAVSPKPKATKAEGTGDEGDRPRTGFTRRSVTRARPAREAASGVRVVSSEKVRRGTQTSSGKSESEMTKEERRAARNARRDDEDRRATASRILLDQRPEFKKSQHVWWALIGSGLVITLITWSITYFRPEAATNPGSPAGIVMLVAIVLAYVAIIASFVYDWRKVRPLRRAVDAEVASMSSKKVIALLESDARRHELEREEKSKKR